jgi:hypothetical protein
MTFSIGLFIGLFLGLFIAGPVLFAAMTIWLMVTDIPIEEEHRQ